MNSRQLLAIKHLKDGKNVILIGQAGTGKSKLLKELSSLLPDKSVFITSTTGISALNIGGVTLQSFLGIHLGTAPKEELLKKVKSHSSRYLYKKNALLCIDEDSMLPLVLFEKLNWVFKQLRQSEEPFGGIQILLSGDFLQLEPIKEQLIYKSPLIDHFEKVILTHNYRQEKDTEFQTLLDNLRYNRLTTKDIELLEDASKRTNDGIKIFCLNKDILKVNNKYLSEIKSKEYKYTARYSGDIKYSTELKKQFESRGIDIITLKLGLKVMLTRNDSSTGLVNGSIGQVIDFQDNKPVVEIDGRKVVITENTWELQIGGTTLASVLQIPLIMAYASSVHRVQGLTLESATVDLRNAFCNHQVYVALSRVKTLNGLAIKNFDYEKIKVNQETVEFYNSIDN